MRKKTKNRQLILRILHGPSNLKFAKFLLKVEQQKVNINKKLYTFTALRKL